MNLRLPFLLSILFVTFACSAANAQLAIRNKPNVEPATSDPRVAAVYALRRLQADVIVYRSMSDFEAGGRLARVPLAVFEADLRQVSTELEPLLARMPATKARLELTNALDSYRDGVFWWRQIDQPRAVNVSALAYADSNHTAAETAFLSSIPYTVAIHWRQAEKYLRQAEREISNQ